MQRLDIMGRLDRVVDPNNNVISYTYDRFGNRTQITGPHGTLKYTYDQLGRIETVTDQQGNVTRYAYDELGRQKKIACANGTETLYTYDTLSRLTSVVNRKTTGEIITSHKYTLDAAGHRTKIEEAGSTVEYGYDKLNRLTSEKRNGVVTLDDGYAYDPVGNRLTKASLGGNASYTYDGNDRLKSDGKYTYGWDENGNLTSRTGSDGTTTYKYDPENRLIEVSGPNGTVQFAYDAQGNRISRTTSSGTITFVVDPNMPYAQVLEESGPSGAKVYAYGNDMLNVQGPEGTRWFAYDGLGSTRALTDGSGTLTDAYTYEAFGTVVHRTGTSANDFQFTGEQYEAALDMYYLRARYYEPGTGRFGARDPWLGTLALPCSFNKYSYASNDPVSWVDPSGEITIGQVSAMVGIMVMLMITPPGASLFHYARNFVTAYVVTYQSLMVARFIWWTCAYYLQQLRTPAGPGQSPQPQTTQVPPNPYRAKHGGVNMDQHVDVQQEIGDDLWKQHYPEYGEDVVINYGRRAIGPDGKPLRNAATNGYILCDAQAVRESTQMPLSPPYEVQEQSAGFLIKDLAYGTAQYVPRSYIRK